MDDRPTNGLTAETRKLLDTVLEAIDIPYAATTGHEETRARILDQRIMQLKVSLRHLAEAADRGDRYMDEKFTDGLAYLRERLAEMPPAGYVTDEQAAARVAAGASWMDAVRLDYQGPEAGRREFTVTARPWEQGWELHVQGVGVTQSKASPTDAELMARDFIASELDVLSDTFEIALNLREVAQ